MTVGRLGEFRVMANGQEIFDKARTLGFLGRLGFGRLPTDAEILKQLAAIQPALKDAV